MKKCYKNCFLSIVLLMCFFHIVSFAHPGSLDSNGGHWNRKSGTYHYHSGVNTRSSSNNLDVSPTNTPVVTIKPTATPAPTPSAYPKAVTKKQPYLAPLFWLFAFLIFLIFVLLKYIFNTIDEYKRTTESFETTIKRISFLYKFLKETDLPPVPDMYEIGIDKLPKEKNSNNWGDTLTLYKTAHGSKLHTKYNCCTATTPTNVCKHITLSYFDSLLCKKCCKNYVYPDVQWYIDIVEYEKYIYEYYTLKNKKQHEIKSLSSSYNKKCNLLIFKFVLLFFKKKKVCLLEANKSYLEFII